MAALTLTAAEIAELRARHAAVLHRPLASRLIAPFAGIKLIDLVVHNLLGA